MTKDNLILHIEFEKVDDLIVIGRYLDDKPITAETAKELVRLRKEFTNHDLCKLIIVFPKLNNMDKSGRDYLSTDEAKEGILASAMVTNSVLGRAIINFFLKLNNSNKNDFPSKVFNTEEEAIQWIKEINVF